MKSKVVTREEALSRIHDGQTIMFGDWHGEFAADEIIDGMLEKGIKDIDAIAVSAGMADQGVEMCIRDRRQTDAKQVLSEEVIAELNKRLYLIAETIGTQQMVEITYFVPDTKKDGGAYITCSGCVKKIDKYKHTVVMTDQTIIPIEQISNCLLYTSRCV